jgi:uncharacterized membrane protein HdeD (DUF308 family)
MERIESLWWGFLIRGILAIAFGVLLAAYPGPGLIALVWIFGAYAIADGIGEIISAVEANRVGATWGLHALAAVIGIAAGIIAWSRPGVTATVLLIVIAVWAILTGAMELFLGLESRNARRGRVPLWIAGMLSILLGVAILWRPVAGLLAILVTIAVFEILRGILFISMAFRMRGLRGRAAPTIPLRPAEV